MTGPRDRQRKRYSIGLDLQIGSCRKNYLLVDFAIAILRSLIADRRTMVAAMLGARKRRMALAFVRIQPLDCFVNQIHHPSCYCLRQSFGFAFIDCRKRWVGKTFVVTAIVVVLRRRCPGRNRPCHRPSCCFAYRHPSYCSATCHRSLASILPWVGMVASAVAVIEPIQIHPSCCSSSAYCLLEPYYPEPSTCHSPNGHLRCTSGTSSEYLSFAASY